MALVNIEEVLDHLSSDIKRALEQAVQKTVPTANFDRSALFREFKRAVGRKCSTWERVPDRLVKND